MTNIKEKITSKTTKTILFAGLIMTLMLSSSGINYVDASTNTYSNEYVTKNSLKWNPNVPESIQQYRMANLDLASITNSVDRHVSVPVVLDGISYDVNLEPNPIRSLDAKAFLTTSDGMIEVPLEDVKTFKGRIVGQDNSEARLTISGDWMSGHIKTTDDTYFIERLQDYDTEANINDYIIYNIDDVKFDTPFHESNIETPKTTKTQNIWLSEYPIVFTSHTQSDIINVKIILDCDSDFYWDGTSTWQSRQVALLNAIDGIYEDLNVQFDLRAQVCDYTDAELSSSSLTNLYNDLYNRWVDDTRQRHIVHLTSGKALSGGAGISAQLGIEDPKEEGYGLTEQDPSHSSYYRETLFAHEIGHSFGATHEAAGLSNGDNTIMDSIPETGSGHSFVYSDGSIGASYDNANTIHENAETHITSQFPIQ